MSEILHKITIAAPKDAVYRALSTVDGLAAWWTTTTTGESAPGQRIEFRFGTHVSPMRVEALEANERVSWRSEEAGSEWSGTQVTFDLSEDAGRTTLLFGHRAWREATPFLAHCSMKWATFLLSLREYAETGRGRPFPHDLSI